MDIYKAALSTGTVKTSHSPFRRPWLTNNGAAASAAGGGSGGAKGGGGGGGLKGIVAGGITGGIEVCITYPTEYVKTQLQLDDKGATKKYTGMMDCVKKTIQERGFFGLYRGLSILLYGSIPKAAVRFGSFETIKGLLVNEAGELSGGGKFVGGMVAGAAEAVVAVTPMETIKVKFINDQRSATPRFKGFLHGVGLIIKENGIAGIYKGLVPTILKQSSNQAIRFYCMETMKEIYKGGDKEKKIAKPIIALMGVVAGAASVFGNTPIDVIKTRMQGLEASKYKNALDCALQVWKADGLAGFYKGTVPRLGRVCCDVAITFVVYDSFMEWFKKVWP